MSFFDFPFSDLGIFIVFATPGYLAFLLASKIGKTDITKDNIEKGIAIFVSGLICNSIFLVIYAINRNIPINRGLVDLTSYTLPELAIGYLSVASIAVILGTVVGLLIDWGYYRGRERTLVNTWRVGFNLVNEPIEVRVFTMEGKEIHGFIRTTGAVGAARDLLIEFPTEVFRSEGEITREVDLGLRVYVSENSISHISFEEVESEDEEATVEEEEEAITERNPLDVT